MSNARELAQIPSTPSGRRNLIINGAMNVAQRGTTHTSASGYTLDRFNVFNASGSGVWTATQSTDVPSGSGFSSSLKIDVTTADTSNTAFEEAGIAQPIEAQDLQHLAYNTSSAKELTLSFWVKSNKTGNYVVWFYIPDSTDQFSESYTINTANTWEKKTISIPAKTSGGAINNDNGAGLYVQFMLLSGPSYKSGTMPSNWESIVNANRYVDQDVNIFDSTSNEFYLTGVQLEVGSVATEFEHRSYGEELALCQRYFFQLTGGQYNRANPTGYADTTTRAFYNQTTPVAMRATPTMTENNLTINGTGVSSISGVNKIGESVVSYVLNYGNSHAVGSLQQSYWTGTSNNFLRFDAEL